MSDRREVRDYLFDILQAIEDIRSYTIGMSVDAFRKDRKTQQAVIRCLEVVGEATKKIQPALRDRHPETPWQEIAGMRDKLIHEYFGVDLDIVWGDCQGRPCALPAQSARCLPPSGKAS